MQTITRAVDQGILIGREIVVSPTDIDAKSVRILARGRMLGGPEDGGIVVSFLNGVDAPTVEQVSLPANRMGMGWRGYIDFGVSLADPRAVYKSKGAA